jgi:mono/diheme cytochrome c family protein
MKSLSTLTQTQIDAIAAALATTSTPPPPTDGAGLYGTYCETCHGALAVSKKAGATATRISTGISSVSDMKSLSTLTQTQIDAIAAALATTSTPPPPTDGAGLYGTYCATCHGALATSKKGGATATQISTGISSVSDMNYLSALLTSAQIQAIAGALATITPPPLVCGSCHAIPPATGRHDLHVNSEGVSCGTCHGTGYSKTTVNAATHMNGVTNIASTPGWNPTTRSCSNSCHGTHSWGGTASTPPTSTTGTIDGAALYTQYCSGCHGSGKKGESVSSIQSAISSVSEMRSLSVLTSAQLQAISTGSTIQAPTTTTTTASGTIDGAALYTQYCSGCHGPLASSGHRGATVTQIQTGINTISGMMPLSTLTLAELQAISDALNSTTSTPPSTTTPSLVCGSCHTIPPGTGHHSTHRSRSCSTCHGTGYSSTTVNAATHNNGVKDIASGSTPGWNPTTRSCSNSCHGTERW